MTTIAPGPLSRLVAWSAGKFTRNEPLRVFTAVGANRRLFRWWLPFAGALLMRGRLPREDTELLILRTAWNCRSQYEWVQHVPLATRAGLDPTLAVPSMAADGLTPRQQLLLRVADELHQNRSVAPTTRQSADLLLAPGELIEVCFVVGHYQMVAMTLNALEVQPEPSAVRQLDQESLALAERLRRGATPAGET